MRSYKALNLCLGRVCLQLVTCSPEVIDYITGKCGVFLSADASPDFRLNVSCEEGKTPIGTVAPDLIVSADNGAVTGKFADSALYLNRKEKTGTLFVDARLMPVSLETCLRAVFAALLSWRGDILLHAAGILRNDFAYVFFGPSEAGKSTISTLRDGGKALSDETMILYVKGGEVLAQGTPFWGDLQTIENTPTPFPVTGLYLLHKSETVRLERMKPSQAVAQILANIHSAGQDKFSAQLIQKSLEKIVAKVPCYSLHFTKNEEFWRKIDALRQ